MKTIIHNGKQYGYEVTQPATNKPGKIVVYSMKSETYQDETKEIREVMEEVEEERPKLKKDGTPVKRGNKIVKESVFIRKPVKKEVSIFTEKKKVLPKKIGEIDIFSRLNPLQERQTVKGFIQSQK